MDAHDVLDDAFDRIREFATAAVEGLEGEALTWRPDPGANTIAWLVWHLARVQDDHVAEVADRSQVWESGEWAERFGLAAGAMDVGFGHTPEQVAAIRPDDPRVLIEYLEQVTERSRDFIASLDAGALDRVVDDAWDPPVTLGVRLISVIGDDLQHVGQAAYVRGMYERTQ